MVSVAKVASLGDQTSLAFAAATIAFSLSDPSEVGRLCCLSNLRREAELFKKSSVVSVDTL